MVGAEAVPDDILIHIFSCLRLKDRKNVRLVCKRWYRISYTYSLVRYDVFNIKEYWNVDRTVTSDSRHVNVKLSLGYGYGSDYEITPDSYLPVEFWKNHGHAIKSLTLTFHADFIGFLPYIFASCPELECLHIISFISSKDHDELMLDLPFFTVHFPKLYKLRAVGRSDRILPILEILTNDAPKLEILYLRGVSAFKKDNFGVALSALSQIFRQATRLQDVTLSHIQVDYDTINVMLDVAGPQLQRAAFINCELLCGKSLDLLSKVCINLRQLILEGHILSDHFIGPAISNMSQLTAFSIATPDYAPFGVFCAIEVLLHLSHLSLFRASKEGLSKALTAMVRPKMLELHIAESIVDDDTIEKILSNLPNLRTLRLSWDSEITVKSLNAICKHNTSLECLSVTNCRKVKSLNLSRGNSINDLKQLYHLDLWGLHLEKDIKYLKLPFLEVFDYNGSMFPEVVAHCPALKYWNRHYYEKGKVVEVLNVSQKRNVSFLKCCNSSFTPCYNNESHGSDFK